jgi:hypothetical protein
MPETQGQKLTRLERRVRAAADQHATQQPQVEVCWEPNARTIIAASLSRVGRPPAMVEISHVEWDDLADNNLWDDLQRLVEHRTIDALRSLDLLRTS